MSVTVSVTVYYDDHDVRIAENKSTIHRLRMHITHSTHSILQVDFHALTVCEFYASGDYFHCSGPGPDPGIERMESIKVTAVHHGRASHWQLRTRVSLDSCDSMASFQVTVDTETAAVKSI